MFVTKFKEKIHINIESRKYCEMITNSVVSASTLSDINENHINNERGKEMKSIK